MSRLAFIDGDAVPLPMPAASYALVALVLSTGCDDAGGAPLPPGARADVTAVSVAGDPSGYRFAVTVRSPDTGCDLYADWWEVLTPEGALVHRRILAHSHVDEQPFTRSGGVVAVAAEAEVIVRAHMSVGGYGGRAMRGSVAAGFAAVSLGGDFAGHLAREAPQPDGCAF